MGIDVLRREDGSIFITSNGKEIKIICSIIYFNGRHVSTNMGSGTLLNHNGKVHLLDETGALVQIEL